MFKKSKGLKSKFIDMQKFDLKSVPEELRDKLMNYTINVMNGTSKAKKKYKREIKETEVEDKEASEEFWNEVIKKAKSLGIGLIGFAPVEEDFIFEMDFINGIKQLFKYGIVLGMEMDAKAINKAPNLVAGVEAQRIYGELGIATNKLAEFIRSKDYRAIACHPLGGPILYPAMAVKANLGEIGKQGLLISKEFGPRQRLSMITTNASPLPKTEKIDFKISKYCKTCGICAGACPVGAIYDEPVQNEQGNVSRIDSDKCFDYFYETLGCSVCIKVCPFNRVGYEKIMR